MFATLGSDIGKIFFFVNPHIILPLFLSMTQNYTNSERQSLGNKFCIYSLFLGYAFVFGGGFLLKALDIPIALFTVGGGILLGVAAWGILYSQDSTEVHPDESPSTVRSDPSLSPLAFPITTGPATLTGLVAMAQSPASTQGGIMAYSSVLLAFTIVIGIVYLFVRCGDFIIRALGKNGCLILSKVGGILLIAMSTTMICGGLKAFFLAS